jgi:hypothetical protein
MLTLLQAEVFVAIFFKKGEIPRFARNEYYEMLKKYSFRLFLRDVIKHQPYRKGLSEIFQEER